MVPDLFIILGMMGFQTCLYFNSDGFPDWFYYRRSDGAPDLSIISSDGVPDLLTVFVSVGLLIWLPREHLSDQQIMTAGRWKSLAFKKFIRPTVFLLYVFAAFAMCACFSTFSNPKDIL